ncbi:hypothetical protein, conserved [Eimeria praecox]|uniref:CP-type G domain-containing protein n=1 Tax=Eimeria praecox TaxID=51316 RepID=U6G7M3_9EIME|nr:hypothetical protein, conserved [Eimeria praecox]
MPPPGGKPGGKGRNRSGGFGSAVLHQCLRKQAEKVQSHHAFVQSMKDEGERGRAVLGSTPAGVAFGGTISRHRTLEFLAGTLASANPAKGSTQSKHSEQYLRSIIERSGLDEYIATSLAAQDTFLVDRYATRLLQEPTTSVLVPKKRTEGTAERADFIIEGTDVPIPRRPVLFSRQMAEECKKEDSKDHATGGVSQATRNRRRRNRARVNLLLSGKVEEATVQNVQFVRQQRDELHRRFQKAREAKSSKRRIRQTTRTGVPAVNLGDGDTNTDEEDQWEADSAATASEAEGSELEEGSSSDSAAHGDSDNSSNGLHASFSGSVTSEGEDTAPPSPHPTEPRFPKTAEELDELELDGFLKWRRMLASMEDEGVLLTPFEKNIEVWRQLWRVIERSNLILQIVDGRSPLFFRCRDLEKYVKEVSADKRVILVINKSDLLPPVVRAEWSQYFAENGVEAVFFSALRELEQCEQTAQGQFRGNERSDKETETLKRDDADLLQSTDEATPELASVAHDPRGGNAVDVHSDVINCDMLVKLLLKYRDEFFSKRRVDGDTEPSKDFVVGTVGYPNVGKSSLINALLSMKKVSVSQQPGKTRRLQTIPLKGRGITLCDCPGLVFPKAVASKHILVLNGVVPIDEMRGDYLPSVQLICDAIPYTLIRHLGITADAYRAACKGSQYSAGKVGHRKTDGPAGRLTRIEALHVLEAVAAHRHFVSGGKGGQLDIYRAAKLILRDFTTGRLRRCHLPKGTVYGEDEETANIDGFLSAVSSSVETRIVEAGASKVVPGSAPASSLKNIPGNDRCQRPKMNPMDVLQELEQDADLLEVLEGGGDPQAVGGNLPCVLTKRKARQLQKQMLKGKGKSTQGGLPHRL